MRINLLEVPIYYINLTSDTHNKTAIQEQLPLYGFSSVTKFGGVKNDNSRLGCTQSHHKLLNQLKDTDTPYIILEDDARIANFVDTINVPRDADAVYLGNSKYGLYGGKGVMRISAEPLNDNLFRVYNMLGAHAILYLNKEYAKFIREKMDFFLETGDHHDKLRAETMKYFKIYALDRPLFYQNGEHEQETNFTISEYGYTDKEWSH